MSTLRGKSSPASTAGSFAPHTHTDPDTELDLDMPRYVRGVNSELVPGDVIRFASGKNGELIDGLVLDVHLHETGSASIVWRYATNPRGVAWRGFLEHDEEYEVLGHDAGADLTPRSLLPAS